MTLKLIIGNRNYSSWSLRAWLYLKLSGLHFDEHLVPLFEDGWREQLAAHTPAGRVPVLGDGDLTVWDTLAIFAHLEERFPESALGWPADAAARAHARSISAEMHSGFLAIRGELPQNLRRRGATPDLSADAKSQIARVRDMWRGCLTRYGGPWLFGEPSTADVMYAPVALRFVSYGVVVDGPERAFIDAVVENEHVLAWCAAAADEPHKIAFVDTIAALDDVPMALG